MISMKVENIDGDRIEISCQFTDRDDRKYFGIASLAKHLEQN